MRAKESKTFSNRAYWYSAFIALIVSLMVAGGYHYFRAEPITIKHLSSAADQQALYTADKEAGVMKINRENIIMLLALINNKRGLYPFF